MARHRQTTALFEVIDRSRPLSEGPRNGVMSALRGWFRAGPGAAPAARSEGAVPAPPPLPAHRPVSVDPERGELSLRLSYASAVTVGIAILAGLGIAFLAGRKAGSPRPAVAVNTTDQIRNLPPRANLTNLASVPDLIAEPAIELTAPPISPRDGDRTERVPAPPRTRSIGLNYVIIQSYPDEKTASEAKGILAQNGLDCTVEKALPGWGTPTWHTVVGLEGFTRISSNPPFDAYVKKVKDVSDKFAKKNSFKAFDPKPYKWGKK